ncbi:MFS transporter [Haloferula helveola]|uniref:MFS transporter n=1 Tax=Haloferula helveola TaxID=490095 RepID=A0ABM7R8V3_9BACT|nr:MFS transporter [Haloferula helveola]
MTDEAPKATKTHQEHPLANILINVLVPVLVLSYLSKDPALQEQLGKSAKPWHIGPLKALIVALVLPLGYGVWHFAKTRKFNFFSGLGLFSVLLTGGLTLYLWNKDGTVKENAGLLFGLKEAAIPLALGLAVFFSKRTATPLLNVFLYNDSLFDIRKIEQRVDDSDNRDRYRSLLDQANVIFAGSFFLSSALNLLLALWFFRGFDRGAADALEVYNGIIGKLTGWGFAVIGIPLLAIMFLLLKRLLKGLHEITGLKEEELLLPR